MLKKDNFDKVLEVFFDNPLPEGIGFQLREISRNIKLAPKSVKLYLDELERVNLNTSNQVSSVDNIYDIVNYKLNDNSYDLDVALENSSLSSTKISLPVTSDNALAQLSVGDVVRVTFYYMNTSDNEILYFSGSGEQITDKIFVSVDKKHRDTIQETVDYYLKKG